MSGLSGNQSRQFNRYGGAVGGPWAQLKVPEVVADQSTPVAELQCLRVHQDSTLRVQVALGTLTSARLHVGRWRGGFVEDRVVLIDGNHTQVDIAAADGESIGFYLTHLNGSVATGASLFYRFGGWAPVMPIETNRRLTEYEILDATGGFNTNMDVAASRTTKVDLYDYKDCSLIVDVTAWNASTFLHVWCRQSGLVAPAVATAGHWSPCDLADNLAAATGISTGHPYRFDIDAADGAGRYALHFNAWQEWTSALVWATGAGAVGTVRVSARR